MRVSRPLAMLMAVLLFNVAQAQEGYPLDGTWRGEWGQPGAASTLVVLVMNWDGHAIKGRINPGRNMLAFTSAILEASKWQVHIEAISKEGKPIIIEGKLDNIGSYHRTLTGTWTQDDVANSIVLTRE